MTKVKFITKKEFIELEKKFLLGKLTVEEEMIYKNNKEEFNRVVLQPSQDNIHPEHYKGKVQPIDLIDAQDLNFNLGNVVKYCCRQGKKESALDDLKKAQYYLNREIQKLENK